MRISSQGIGLGRVAALLSLLLVDGLSAEAVTSAQPPVAPARREVPPAPTIPDILKQASQHILRKVDPVNGGFGGPDGGPKFLHVPDLDLLLAATEAGDDQAGRALTKTLETMAYSGIDDQIGGGFYRYATDQTWTITRFEKLLSDNAQLLSLYTRSYVPTRTPFLRDVAAHIARYLIRDMQAPDGGFYTAQDAGGGASDLWTRAEIADELGPVDTARFFAVYELVPMAAPSALRNTTPPRPGAGVLRVRQPIEETVQRVGATDLISMQNALALLRAELLARRKDRPQPRIDERIVTSLNGLAIGALAQAGADLEHPDLVVAAEKAATRIWTVSYDPVIGLVRREIVHGRAEIDGDLGDYAMLADGLLTLSNAIRDDAKKADGWRWRAEVIADAMLARFAKRDGVIVLDATSALKSFVPDDDSDDAIVSARSAALKVLLRLGERSDGTRFRKAAAPLAAALRERIATRPQAWPGVVATLARHSMAPATAEPVR